jgi:riboflavin synthase
MFTGIVEELGEVVGLSGFEDSCSSASHATGSGTFAGEAARLAVRGRVVTADARPGDSIAVNGVCLTVVETRGDVFTADVMAETLKRSNLGALRRAERVNLERAATLGTRMGGHLVQGHVDGAGTILSRTPGREWTAVRFSLPPGLSRYVVEKGSITVDGVSLTVVAIGRDANAGGGVGAADNDGADSLVPDGPGLGTVAFEVGLIPTTLALTTLGHKNVGDLVNLEVDVIAKYVERLLLSGRASGAGKNG